MLLLRWVIFGLTLFAATNALTPLPAELAAKEFPSQMAEAGAAALAAVKFVDSSKLSYASAMYVPALREIMLSRSLADAEGNSLKPLDQMGADDLGVVIHELWHSYFHAHPELKPQVLAGVDSIYAAYPAAKREEIQDEAFGLFIQKVVAANIGLKRIEERSAPDVWTRLRANTILVSSYERTFTEADYGYYQAGTPWNRTFQWSHIPLPQVFKDFILQVLLENKITGNFERDFPKKF